VSVPLIVATVFGATFLVVCAVAWVLLGRSSSAAPTPAPSPEPHSQPLPPSPASSFDAPRPASFEIESIRSTEKHAIAPNRTTLRFYQALMFVTGGIGLLASALMFSAVTEISRLLFIAIVVFLGSCLAIYRGFVPDSELTGKK
jgi:hypothetical protein